MKIIADWLRRIKRKKMTGKNTGQKEETETEGVKNLASSVRTFIFITPFELSCLLYGPPAGIAMHCCSKKCRPARLLFGGVIQSPADRWRQHRRYQNFQGVTGKKGQHPRPQNGREVHTLAHIAVEDHRHVRQPHGIQHRQSHQSRQRNAPEGAGAAGQTTDDPCGINPSRKPKVGCST